MASTAELITLLTSGAAFVTALATLWTVIELRSQRKDARKPELTPVRQAVYAKITGEEPAPLTFLWDRWSESRSKEPNGNYSIQLFNIGNGPAKDIHIAWEYQVDELVAIFNRASQQNLQDSFLQRLGQRTSSNSSPKQSARLPSMLIRTCERNASTYCPAPSQISRLQLGSH
jgi:hypothetical protein